MDTEEKQGLEQDKKHKKRSPDQLETIGWGLFLILIGVVWLFPKDAIPEGSLFIGIGVILIGISLIRYFRGKKLSEASIFLGIIAIAIGFRRMLDLKFALIPLILIVMGAIIVAGVMLKQKSH